MVSHTWTTYKFGLIIGWWVKNKQYAVVLWKNKVLHCHKSKLEIINESS